MIKNYKYMSSISKDVYIDKLDDIVNKHIVIRNGKIVWKQGAYLAEFQCSLGISGVARPTLHQLSSKWQAHMEIFFIIMIFMQL